MKQNGTRFSDAETRSLQVGTIVYLPAGTDTSRQINNSRNDNPYVKPPTKPSPQPQPNPPTTPTPNPPTDPFRDSYNNVTFQLNNQSLWGVGSLPNLKDERSINLINEDFNVGVGSAYLKFGLNSSLFASPGTLDASIKSNFSIVHPTTAHPGDVITFNLYSDLIQASQNTYLGVGYKVGGYIDLGFKSSVPFIPSFSNSFAPDFTSSLQNYIPNLGITTSAFSSGNTITSEGKNDYLKFDLYSLFPGYVKDQLLTFALQNNIALGAELGLIFKQKSNLNINQFMFDFNGQTASTDTRGGAELVFTIPKELTPGSTYTIVPKVKPKTILSSSFSLAVKGSLYAQFPYVGKHDLSLNTPDLTFASTPNFDPFNYFQTLQPIKIQIV